MNSAALTNTCHSQIQLVKQGYHENAKLTQCRPKEAKNKNVMISEAERQGLCTQTDYPNGIEACTIQCIIQ